MKNKTTPITYPLVIYYDASCPLCTAEMSNLMRRNTEGLLEFVDASPVGFESPITGTSQWDLMNLIHARCADGRTVRGVAVFQLAYEGVGLGWVTALTKWPGIRSLADWAYPILVRNRYRIPRWLVRIAFEGPTRRAAIRAAAQRCDAEGISEAACERHDKSV
jgi:predicted DCC family thiol-disulfide oxidoreductase YuxK